MNILILSGNVAFFQYISNGCPPGNISDTINKKNVYRQYLIGAKFEQQKKNILYSLFPIKIFVMVIMDFKKHNVTDR